MVDFDYQKFRKGVLKAVFYGHGEAVMNAPENAIVVDRAFDLACRNLPVNATEMAIHHTCIRYVRMAYPYLLHWC